MSFHTYAREDLCNVTTERYIGRDLRVKSNFWGLLGWRVEEWAKYECAGDHRKYMGSFYFMEEEFTGASWQFASRNQAEMFAKK